MVELSLAASRASTSIGSMSLSTRDMVPKGQGKFPTKIVSSRRTTVSPKQNTTTQQSTYRRSVKDQMEWNWRLLLPDICLKGTKQQQKVSEEGGTHQSGEGTGRISASCQAISTTKIPGGIYCPRPSIICKKEVLGMTCVRDMVRKRR